MAEVKIGKAFCPEYESIGGFQTLSDFLIQFES